MDGTEIDQIELTGREAVRAHFVQRLEAAGLQRAKSATERDHADVLRRLVEYLAYLSVPSLVTLADQVLDAATGPKRDRWPTELLIRQMAEALERRPFEEKPIVRSWLASVEGPIAEAGGYLVELFRHLRAHPRPVLPHDLRKVREAAGGNRRRMQMIFERQRAGDHRPDDGDFAHAYRVDEARAREIVERGRQARVAKQGEGVGQ